MGELSIDSPVVDDGVLYDEETKQVTFTRWRPQVFETQALFSLAGLDILRGMLEDSPSPVPSFKPHLIYAWRFLMASGEMLSQFWSSPETTEELTRSTKGIDMSDVIQVQVCPHYTSEDFLPSYTYNHQDGSFYKAGVQIDLDYEGGPRPPDAQPYYARKVSQTMGSTLMHNSMERGVSLLSSSVLQLVGWVVDENSRCIISIDERGQWRPYDYGKLG